MAWRAGRGRCRSLALFAFSPVVMENATYTCTKNLSAFFVVLAFWFYLAGWRKNDRVRIAAAFLALSAGLLVHYSAGPYCLLLGLHYLLRVFWKRPRKWRELAAIVVPCALLLATWFAWSAAVYGRRATFQSNTSVTSARQYGGNNLLKIGANLADSIVPYMLRSGLTYTGQPNPAGVLRDNVFGFYQVNLIFGMGLVGGPLVLWLLWGFVRRRSTGLREWQFWRVFDTYMRRRGGGRGWRKEPIWRRAPDLDSPGDSWADVDRGRLPLAAGCRASPWLPAASSISRWECSCRPASRPSKTLRNEPFSPPA